MRRNHVHSYWSGTMGPGLNRYYLVQLSHLELIGVDNESISFGPVPDDEDEDWKRAADALDRSLSDDVQPLAALRRFYELCGLDRRWHAKTPGWLANVGKGA